MEKSNEGQHSKMKPQPPKGNALEMEESSNGNQNSHKGTTFLRTCFNGLNALSGIGLLTVPYALSQGGWLSLIILFTVAIFCCYTGLLLKRCMDTDPKIKTYPDIGHKAFGPKGKTLISFILQLQLFLLVVEYLILEGDNLNKLFPNMRFKIGMLKIGGREGFLLISAAIVLPTTWLKSLGLLAYVSVGGVLAGVVLIVCVFCIGTFDGVSFHEHGVLLDWRGLLTTVSLFTFCFTAHGVFPTLCNSMNDRSQFSKVLLVCFATSTIGNALMAIQGYLMYGQELSSQITLNLPVKVITSQIAIYATLVNPLAKYAITLTPIFTIIEDKFQFIKRNKILTLLTRTIIVICTVVVALSVPFFGYIMAFIGSCFCVTVSMVLPCLCYMKIYEDKRRFGIEMVVIVVILIFGLFVGVFGTFNSLKHITTNL